MTSLHLEKKGIRGLAIAESFNPDFTTSILSGIVMRRDFIIDGFVFGHTSLKGDDATDVILKMYDDLRRSDINYILISGLIISMYNIIDIEKLFHSLKIPIISITYNDSLGIENALKHHFPDSFESKINICQKLAKRKKITLRTSHDVFVRKEGCALSDVKHLLDEITLQGAIPEPIRVSQLLARKILEKGSSF